MEARKITNFGSIYVNDRQTGFATRKLSFIFGSIKRCYKRWPHWHGCVWHCMANNVTAVFVMCIFRLVQGCDQIIFYNTLVILDNITIILANNTIMLASFFSPSFCTLLLSSFWTSHGHRCPPFFPPVLAFNFYSA